MESGMKAFEKERDLIWKRLDHIDGQLTQLNHRLDTYYSRLSEFQRWHEDYKYQISDLLERLRAEERDTERRERGIVRILVNAFENVVESMRPVRRLSLN